MKAMVIDSFGGPEQLRERDLPVPEPGPGQLLVRLRAASVNPVDYKIRRNGTWAGIVPPAVLGWDAAGVVERTGPGVKDFRPGDEVFYTAVIGRTHPGTYAQYHVTPESVAVRKPEELDFQEAAALPLAGCTAWSAVVERAQVRLGETVLIHAAAGGVGSLAVQMAKAAGARVLGVTSTRKMELVGELGADLVIDHDVRDFVEAALDATGGLGVDFVFDTVGDAVLARSVSAVRPHGRIVTIVSAEANLAPAYRRNLTVHFLFMERARHRMEALVDLVRRRLLRPVIDSVVPLGEVADAHRRLERGETAGKIVLEIP